MQESGGRAQPGRRALLVLPAVAGLLFVLLAGDAARRETPTIDEFAHLAAGHAVIEHGWLALYAKNPPLGKMLMALPGRLLLPLSVPEPGGAALGWGPWHYGARFMQANAEHYFEHFHLARAIVIAGALLTALLVFVWARSLFGTGPAAIATSIFLLSPTLLAHGHLATLDVLCTLAMTASAFALRWACAKPSSARFALVGLSFGVALLVKFTPVLLVPGFVVVAVYRRWPEGRRALVDLGILGVSAILVVNVGMGFRGSFARVGDYEWASDFGQGLDALLPDALPIPLPHDWVRGFDAQKRDVERGEFPSYLMGRWSADGFAAYDLLAFFVKTPELFPLLLAAAGFALWRRPHPPSSGSHCWHRWLRSSSSRRPSTI